MTGNREDAIARSTQYLDTGEFEAELARRVAIRTESQIADNTKPLDEYIHHEMVPAFEQMEFNCTVFENPVPCLLYTSPSPRDATLSRMPSSA